MIIGKIWNDLQKLFIKRAQTICDPNFGDVEVRFDDSLNTYFLEQDVKIDSNKKPIYLYIEAKSKQSTSKQKETFDYIQQNFEEIWTDILNYLYTKLNPIQTIEKDYRIESITIESHSNLKMPNWEIELANQIDGFSKILIFMNLNKPKSYSIEG